MAFVFYDTETTGTETAFDQILQFAAIRTDEDLNELDSVNIRCRLSPYVVPAPGAMRVTGVSADILVDPSLPSHYEMMREIHRKLSEWSPALFVGYNSIRFDEELLRQAFYKSLLPVFLTNTNGNSRSDVMRMVQACSIYSPGLIVTPLNNKGNPSFKLEHVAPANGYSHENAHDALEDVRATIFLAKLVEERSPDIWSAFMRFCNRRAVSEFIADEELFSHSDVFFGKPFSCEATLLGPNPDQASEMIIFNLAVDPGSLAHLSNDELQVRLSSYPKPVRSLKANQAPMIMPFDAAAEVSQCADILDEELERRASILSSDQELRDRLIDNFLATKDEFEPSPHVEKQIYGVFPEDGDKALMAAFHKAPWSERLSIVDSFNDPRFREIGRRLIFCESPGSLDPEVFAFHEVELANRLLGTLEGAPWHTLPKAIQEAEDLLSVATSDEADLLQGHKDYLFALLDHHTSKLV